MKDVEVACASKYAKNVLVDELEHLEEELSNELKELEGSHKIGAYNLAARNNRVQSLRGLIKAIKDAPLCE